MQQARCACCRGKTYRSAAAVASPSRFYHYELKLFLLLLLAADEIFPTVWISGAGKLGTMQPRLFICFIRFKFGIPALRTDKHFAMSAVQDDKFIEDFFDESSKPTISAPLSIVIEAKRLRISLFIIIVGFIVVLAHIVGPCWLAGMHILLHTSLFSHSPYFRRRKDVSHLVGNRRVLKTCLKREDLSTAVPFSTPLFDH